MELLDLVATDPEICHGQATIKGTRVLVSTILDCLAGGMSDAEILDDFPSLDPESIRAAIAYGALLAREELLPLRA